MRRATTDPHRPNRMELVPAVLRVEHPRAGERYPSADARLGQMTAIARHELHGQRTLFAPTGRDQPLRTGVEVDENVQVTVFLMANDAYGPGRASASPEHVEAGRVVDASEHGTARPARGAPDRSARLVRAPPRRASVTMRYEVTHDVPRDRRRGHGRGLFFVAAPRERPETRQTCHYHAPGGH